eukprot:7697506-Pyramimonas_sp.AAC.1
MTGIPSGSQWSALFGYSLSRSTIGARYGYILSPLLRLVPTTGVAAGSSRAPLKRAPMVP